LEVGSGASGLAAWWPGRVVGVDLRFDGEPLPNLTTVEASAGALPFPDRAFPAVVCTDVFEHLPCELREAAFAELLRVSSGLVWVAFPFGDYARRHDQLVLGLCRLLRRQPPGWLVDHIELGFPSGSDVASWESPGFRRVEQQRMSWLMHLSTVILGRILGERMTTRLGRSDYVCDALRRIPGGACHREMLLMRMT